RSIEPVGGGDCRAHWGAALMPTPFNELLAEFVRQAQSGDERCKRLFRDGDVEHLKRWSEDGRAAEIYQAERGGEEFTMRSAFAHIMIALEIRRLAESMDALNKDIGQLERGTKRLASKERKRARKMLANREISPAEFTTLMDLIKKFEPIREYIDLDPQLSVRSDEKGTAA